jgi:multidrug efflux pump subunit AcrA (membrane-fusion protein)
LDSSDIESNISALTYSQKAILDQIDSAKAQIEASNTQYINAKKEYERYKGLYEKELISKEQLENMENLYKQALANKENALSKVKQLEDQAKSVAGQIESLKSNLKYTEYRAPFPMELWQINLLMLEMWLWRVSLETVPKLISQLKLNTQNQKIECLHEKNRNIL